MDILPIPVRTHLFDGHFVLPTHDATVSVSSDDLLPLAEYLQEELQRRCSIRCAVVPAHPDGQATVTLSLQSVPELDGVPLKHEGYVLDVSDAGVHLAALEQPGIFYSIQSLLQLLPWSAQPPERALPIAKGRVVDYPRFTWRGALLDVGRHIFSVSFIKRFLDVLAMHKINKFHWHLTEDQGWRIEIKGLPRLTEVGAWRGHGDRRYGGYYTQDQVRDIVAYAARRFIEVIPEIELPGHCKAALACYPELSCTGDVPEVPTQWGVQTDVYCAGKDSTFHFLEAVLDEVVELFPSKYLHIGGDECPKVRWAECPLCQQRMHDENIPDEDRLQTWFIQRVAAFLATRGKHIIGWDEILEGGIPEGAVVMSWRGTSGGVLAAKQKHQVIMCPNNRCYFDYRQSASIQEPGTWYAVLPLEWVYMFDPYCRPRDALCSSDDDETAEHFSDAREDADDGAAEHIAPADSSIMQDVTPADSEAKLGGSETHDGAGSTRMSSAATSVAAGDGTAEPSGAEGACGSSSRMDTLSGGTKAASDVLDAPLFADALGAAAASPVAQEPAREELTSERVDLVSGQMSHALTRADEQYIIGGQGNLWTEFISDEATAEYMLLPRLCALSECLWSPVRTRNWRGFLDRAQSMLNRLNVAGYNYRPLSTPCATSP